MSDSNEIALRKELEDVRQHSHVLSLILERIFSDLEECQADRKVLAEEVMAWRNHDDLHECLTNTDYQQRMNVQTHDRACEAAQRTDNSGALIRAKEINQ